MLDGSVEIFVQYGSNCIFYYNFQDPTAKFPQDIQMVSGFLDAAQLFFNELKFAPDSRLFRILRGNTELRMVTATADNPMQATLLLRGLSDLDDQAYHELDELVTSIMDRFTQVYMAEITNMMETGRFLFKGIEAYIQEETIKMCLHIYSSYLLKILGLAINRKVAVKDAMKLISAISQIYRDFASDFQEILFNLIQIRTEIEKLKNRIGIQKILKKVNKDNAHIWKLFLVPIISPN